MDTRPTLNREQRRKLEKAKRLQTKKVKKIYDNLAPQVKQQVYKKMYEKIKEKMEEEKDEGVMEGNFDLQDGQ